MHFSLCTYVYLHMKNWKKACTVIYGYSYIQKNHIYAHNYVHIGQFPQDGENGQNVAFCSFFWSSTVTKRFDFFLLRCYCREPDYHLGDYPYNVHGNLKWNTKSHGRQQCWIVLMQLCMKYADVLADQYIAGGYATHTGQHVGTASNLWKGKWFNLNRPGLN